MRVFLAVVLAAAVTSVLAAENACQNGGEMAKGVCKCKKGYTGKHCEIAIRCCLIYGDPHFLTFDGAKIDFQGSCSYQAAGVCPCVVIGEKASDLPKFNVVVDTWRKGKSGVKVSWTRSVTVSMNNHSVTVDQGTAVSVNGAKVMLPYKSIPGVQILHSGDYVRIESDFGASVSFDGNTRALICVPEKWNGKTCGICGNNNGNKRDDFVTRDGTNVYNQREERGNLIGNSWRDLSKDTSSCKEEIHEIRARPSHKWVEKAKDMLHCGAIVNRTGPFSKCISKLGNGKIMSFYEGCLFDVYESQPDLKEAKNMACSSLSALMTECREIGTPVASGWRDVTSCRAPCAKGFRYSADATACPATCADPEAPSKCEEPNTEACVCESGLLLADGKCVKPKKCGCTDEMGTYHAVKSKWFDDACTTRFRCKETGTGLPEITTEKACKDNEMCKAVNGKIKCVKKPVAGGWTEFGEWSECQKFGADEGLVRVRVRSCTNPAPKHGGQCEGSPYETQQCI